MKNNNWKRIAAGFLSAVFLMSNVADTGISLAANAAETDEYVQDTEDSYAESYEEVTPDVEEPAYEDSYEETNEEPAYEEEVPAELPETTEGETAEEAAEEATTESDEKVAVNLSMRIVDENGESIDSAYEDLTVPEFDTVLDLTASPYENDVVKVRNVEGTYRYYALDYTYDYAEIDGAKAASVRREQTEDGGYAYSYSTDGAEYTELTADSTIVLHYTSGQEKVEYVYEDDSVKVTATLDSADAIPDNADFVVTPVTEQTTGYNYAAYMEALNAAEGETEEATFTSENTLLYDIAFMTEKTDAEGNSIEGAKVEVEPESGAVAISAQFKSAQLSEGIGAADAENVQVKHLVLNDSVNADVDSTKEATAISASDITVENLSADAAVEGEESVEFKMDSFSLIAVTENDSVAHTYDGINYESVLGDATEFGIVSKKYNQSGSHTETNFAVYEYINHDQVVEVDLTNEDAEIPFIIGTISDKLRFGIKTDNENIDVYTQASEEGKISQDNQDLKIKVIERTEDQIKNTVDGMINDAMSNAATLAELTPTTGVRVEGKTIDTTNLPDNVTIVIDAGKIFNDANTWQNEPIINKLDNQNIVFNVGDNYPFSMLRNFVVTVNGGQPIKSTQDNSGNDSDHNKDVDCQILRHIIWNVTTSKVNEIQDSSGAYLFSNNNNVNVRNSAGWIVSNGDVTAGGEWHFVYHERKYHSQGEEIFSASKTMDGQTPEEGKFTFTLKELNSDGSINADGVVQTKTNDAEGKIAFEEIDYTQDDLSDSEGTGTGVKNYIIQEQIPEGATERADGNFELNEIVYDSTVYFVEVTLTDDGNNVISTEHKFYKANYDSETSTYSKGDEVGEAGMNFANNTAEKEVSAEIKATKSFNDWGKAQSFTFTLEAKNDAPMPEGAADGKLSKNVTESEPEAAFGEITYTAEGTYEYTITETDDEVPGVTYDTTPHNVIVTVEKGSDGNLKATVTYEGKDNLTITNKYSETSAELKATKSINYWGDEVSFTFELSAADGTPMPANTTATATKDSRTASFGEITYTSAGTYTYTIKEQEGNAEGVTYDTEPHTAVVKVVKNDDGELEVESIKYDGQDALTITNDYTYAAGTVTLQATKAFDSWGKAGSFTFTLESKDNAPMPEGAEEGKLSKTVTEGSETAVFGEISYEKVGTYNYTITETDDGVPGVTYDTKAHDVVVTVEEGEAGKLKATVAYDGKDSLTITNKYSDTKAELQATKAINYWGEEVEFTFTLEGKDNAPMPENTTATATKDKRTVGFGEITYTSAGTYNYTITEQEGSAEGVTYDTTPHNAVVTVVEKDGELEVESIKYDGEDALTITNDYTYAAGTVTLQATKAFDSWGKANSFTFTLEGKDDAPMPANTTATATKGNETAVFGEITYEKAGTYNYTITETDDKVPGVTYDTTAHEVVVTVVEGSDGKLKATVAYDEAESLTITNTYHEISAELKATKAINYWGEEVEFTFDLEAKDNAPMPANSTATATKDKPAVSFGDITFTSAGTYNYTITEEEGSAEGVTYDTTPHNAVVTVVEKDGELEVESIKYDGQDALTITNDYTYAAGTVTLQATKAFDSWGKADSFTFTLEASDNAPMPKGAADGKLSKIVTEGNETAVFGEITYEKAGTYNYTITETDDKVPGVTYDTTAHEVVVTVVEGSDGKLKATVAYDDAESLTITNTYHETSAELKATKAINYWGEEVEFTFDLEAKDNAPMPANSKATATKDKPAVSFGSITYTSAGTYNYTITEEEGDAEGVTYDTEPHNAVVTVVEKDGELEVESIKYDGQDALTITNDYTYAAGTVTLQATKAFDSWGKADSFTFTLEAKDNAPMPANATATATKGNETAVFGEITYEKAGTYNYTITETDDKVPGVTYDTTAHEVVVTVVEGTDGKLKATVAYDGAESLTITNTYHETSAELKATKAINYWGEEVEFTFTLEAKDNAPMPANSTATATKDNRTASFGNITYTSAGTYNYTITEEEGKAEGVTYDTEPHNAVVTVVEKDGELEVESIKYDGQDALTITNDYTYAADTVTLQATKAFDSWGKADKFTFNLEAKDNAPMPENATATATKGNETAVFGEITYEKAGTYNYTITETDDKVPGVTYDTRAHEVTVTVVEGTDGKLKATVAYDGAESLTITNTYHETNAELKATKAINYWGDEVSFTFELSAADGTPMPANTTATATKDSRTASFGSITYTSAGTYTYTIKEQEGNAEGVTYDTEPHSAVVTVTEGRDGELEVESIKYDGEDALTITNDYTYAADTVTLQATKAFDSWGKADKFTFTLEGKDNAPMPENTTATATKGNETAVFGEITYEKAGTYNYTITETDDKVPGVTYDTTAHEVTVTVVEGTDGKLKATVAYDGAESLTITNTYHETNAELKATKAINYWGKEVEFTFDLEAKDNAPMPANSTATATKDLPTASFGKITYTSAGTYKYTITEQDGKVEGVTYDTKAHEAVVTVVEKDGELEVESIKYDGENALTITNTYTYAADKVTLQATKAFDSWGKADSFTFTLEASDNAPMPEGAADGKLSKKVSEGSETAVFGEITYEEAGTYNYTITETDDKVPGVTYDTEAHKVTVTVKEGSDGKLKATVDYDGAESLTITNTYHETNAELKATKAINYWGKEVEFKFTLEAKDNAPMPANSTATATKDQPTASFGNITFTSAGEYKYTITEQDGKVEGVTYDTKAHEAVVTVVEKDGKLEVESIKYDGGDDPLTITNTYTYAEDTVTLQATKAFNSWGKASKFTFVLEGKDNAPMPEGAADGKLSKDATKGNETAVFGTIKYDKAGTYNYTITEVNSHIPGVTYDTTAHKVTVEVKEGSDGKLKATVSYDGKASLVITNTYTEHTRGVRTGDTANPLMWIIIAVIALAAACTAFVIRRRRS